MTKELTREEYNQKVYAPSIRKWATGMAKGENEWRKWMNCEGKSFCSFCYCFINKDQPCPIVGKKCDGGCGCVEQCIQFVDVCKAFDSGSYYAYLEAVEAMFKHVVSCDYDTYLKLISKEEEIEKKEQALDVDRLYIYDGDLVEITYGKSVTMRNCYDIKNIITGKMSYGIREPFFTLATNEQIEDAYGFMVGNEKVVFYEDKNGILLFNDYYITHTNIIKPLLKKAGLKYIPYKYWKKMKEGDKYGK